MNKSLVRYISIGLFCVSASINAQRLRADKIFEIAEELTPKAISNLKDFVAIPNDSKVEGQLEQNLNYSKNLLEALEFSTQTLTTDGVPVLLASKMVATDLPTVLFYLQIDGQPINKSKWDQEDPYQLTLKERHADGTWNTLPFENSSDPSKDWRLFGRSVSDSKGPSTALLTALEYYHSKKWKTAFNLKLLLDFQEEMGSPTLEKAVSENKGAFDADYLIIMDGTRDVSNKPTVTFGARGIITAQLIVYGPKEPLHSGQYGNYAPNPVFKASRLIASMKDEIGMVLIEDFYKGIQLNDLVRAELANASMDPIELNERLGIAIEEMVSNSYQGSLQYPSLNIRGMQAAWTGDQVRTIIPDKVVVEIDMRTVKESRPEALIEALKNHIVKQGFELLDTEPTDEERSIFENIASLTYKIGSKPFRTAFSSPIRTLMDDTLQPLFGDQYVLTRTTGGSQPIAPFINTLGIDAVSLRIPNPDNNIHAPNENLRIGNLTEGIASILSLLQTPIQN
jgi:acetylornithine deacetylase/succinyl-diaminopimelate desuccinylase-like protein